MSKYRGRFGHFQGQPEMFSNNLLARSRRALAYRGQNVGNRCLWRVLENLRNRAVSRPFFCIFDRFIPKNRQLRAPTHSVRSIQLGIERDISSTGFRHPNENWGHYAPVPIGDAHPGRVRCRLGSGGRGWAKISTMLAGQSRHPKRGDGFVHINFTPTRNTIFLPSQNLLSCEPA